MPSGTSGILTQIEAGVRDDSVPLSTLLQNVLVLGGRANSENMREWARHELNGYAETSLVPDYRRIPAALYVRITNRFGYNGLSQRVPRAELPTSITENVNLEEVPLMGGVGELEAFAAQPDREDKPHWFSPPWGSALVDYINENAILSPDSKIAFAYWEVPNASIKGLLVRVRAALADLVAELVSLTPDEQEIPTQAIADQAIQFVIAGERSTINITTQHSPHGSNVSAPAAVLATDNGTALGTQIASGQDSTVVGPQAAHGDNSTITGRDSTTPASASQEKEGWWARLRKRGLVVTICTIIGSIATVVGAIAAVLTLLSGNS